MKVYKVGDIVRILTEPKNSINAYARVDKIVDGGVRVANMNMPFQGTFSYEFFKFEEVRK